MLIPMLSGCTAAIINHNTGEVYGFSIGQPKTNQPSPEEQYQMLMDQKEKEYKEKKFEIKPDLQWEYQRQMI